MYYTAELQNGASFRNPEPCKAKTLSGAKGVASRRQTFNGTTLMVYNSEGYRIAIKGYNGWFNYPNEFPLNCVPDFQPKV